MCGRFVMAGDVLDLALEFVATPENPIFTLHDWNIAPTKSINFIFARDVLGNQRSIDLASWGLIPQWSKEKSHALKTINARVETVAEKPSFRNAFRRRRCIIPATGYYEWATALGPYPPKQPFYIFNENGSFLPMAGIYEEWIDTVTGEKVVSASILTREATGAIAEVHHRMPIMLEKDLWSRWLVSKSLSEAEVSEYLELLNSESPARGLSLYPVSNAVNSSRNNGAELIKSIALQEPETLF